MAGGIDWFRWHHGSVTDPKFQLVARKSGATLPTVIAVWAYVLEKASAAEVRGSFGDVDCEAVDCLFGLDDGTTAAILAQMEERKLIAGDTVAAWEKRQPKREREGDNSTERVRAFRAAQRQDEAGNAMKRQETPRGEERREEVIPSLLTQATASPVESRPPLSLVDSSASKAKAQPDCPHQAVLALWAEVLPSLPQHLASQWRGARADHLRARWRETATEKGWTTEAEGLTYLRRLFAWVGQSQFLTGKARAAEGRPPFVAELSWLVMPQNWAKVIEGKYHGEAA